MPPFWLKKQSGGCVAPTPYSPDLAPWGLFLSPWMNGDLRGRRFADVVEIQRESLAALDGIFVEDFSASSSGTGAGIVASSHLGVVL